MMLRCRALLTLLLLSPVLLSAPAAAQEHETDPAAMKAFRELIQAYRRRPALTVKSTVTIEMKQGEATSTGDEVEAEITFVPGRRGVVKLKGFTAYLHDDQLQAVHEATDHSYFSTPDDGSPYYVLLNAFNDIPYPHLAIGFGEEEVDEFLCMQFHPKAPYARPTSVSEEVTEGGKNVQRIKMTSDYESVDIVVDPQTMLMEELELKLTGGIFVQPGATAVYKYRFEYETYENQAFDASVLAFDPDKRQRVDMLATLMPRAAAPAPGAAQGGPAAGGAGPLVGEQAPPLVLATADGGAVDLADLEGQVVVLDFWATWCAPCRRALPLLHKVDQWAKDEGLPVTIITVNVFEGARGGEDTPDRRLESVRNFWQDNKFTLPIAMDYTDETAKAYGVQGIPATFVIRSDRVVHAQHSGAGPDFDQMLRSEINEAIQALEQ